MFHRIGDDASDPFYGLDKVSVGEVGIPRHGTVATPPEQFSDQGRVLARHDRLPRRRVAQVVQAKPAEFRIVARSAPALCENSDTPAFGVSWKQERLRVGRRRAPVRPRRMAPRAGRSSNRVG